MAYQQILGKGFLFPSLPPQQFPPAYSNVTIDATGEKVAYMGRVWFPARTGTKAIERVCVRFGTIVKAGGSALTLSLQDVDLTVGPPQQPDGVQDQTVAIANAAIVAGWYRTNTLSANRTVTYGDRLSVVVEYDGAGRLGSDSVILSSYSYTSASAAPQTCTMALFTASWAVQLPGVLLLEFSDGTFGTLDGMFPSSAINSHAIASNTAIADEYAVTIRFPWPCKVDGLWAMASAGADFEIILYDGTSALATVTIDSNAVYSTTGKAVIEPITEQTLLANTTYRVAVRPTTTTAINVYSLDVVDANHLTVHDGGIVCTFDTRLDQGAWIGAVATRRLFAGVRISQLDDGVGGGASGGGPIFGGMVVS